MSFQSNAVATVGSKGGPRVKQQEPVREPKAASSVGHGSAVKVTGTLPMLKPAPGMSGENRKRMLTFASYMSNTYKNGYRTVTFTATHNKDGAANLGPYSWGIRRFVTQGERTVPVVQLTTAQNIVAAPKDTARNIKANGVGIMCIASSTAVRFAETKVPAGSTEYAQAGISEHKVTIEDGLSVTVPNGDVFLVIKPLDQLLSTGPSSPKGLKSYCDTFEISAVLVRSGLEGATVADRLSAVSPSLGRGGGPNWYVSEPNPLVLQHGVPLEGPDARVEIPVDVLPVSSLSASGLEATVSRFFPQQTQAFFVPDDGGPATVVSLGTQRVEGELVEDDSAAGESLVTGSMYTLDDEHGYSDTVAHLSGKKGHLVFPTEAMQRADGFDLSRAESADYGFVTSTALGVSFVTMEPRGDQRPDVVPLSGDPRTKIALPRFRGTMATPAQFADLKPRLMAKFDLTEFDMNAKDAQNGFTLEDYLRALPVESLQLITGADFDVDSQLAPLQVLVEEHGNRHVTGRGTLQHCMFAAPALTAMSKRGEINIEDESVEGGSHRISDQEAIVYAGLARMCNEKKAFTQAMNTAKRACVKGASDGDAK